MKLPRITIDWGMGTIPRDVVIKKLRNGYLLGDTYVKDDRDLADYLVIYIKQPDANLPTPIYSKEKEV